MIIYPRKISNIEAPHQNKESSLFEKKKNQTVKIKPNVTNAPATAQAKYEKTKTTTFFKFINHQRNTCKDYQSLLDFCHECRRLLQMVSQYPQPNNIIDPSFPYILIYSKRKGFCHVSIVIHKSLRMLQHRL